MEEATLSIVLLLCGIGGGIAAPMALIRRHERSWLVWLALLPGLFVLFMIGSFWCHSSTRTEHLDAEHVNRGPLLRTPSDRPSAALGLLLGVRCAVWAPRCYVRLRLSVRGVAHSPN